MSYRALAFGVVLSVGVARTLPGQRLAQLPAGVVRTVDRSVFDTSISTPVAARASVSIAPEAPPRWPFIMTGAIIGGVAAGAWYGYQVARSDDPMLDFTVPVVGLGIGVGALGGWLVGEVVRATHATTRD